jgi:hypothetical protein
MRFLTDRLMATLWGGAAVTGRLGERKGLSFLSQCFLWYSTALWSRPTAGQHGLMLPRLGDAPNRLRSCVCTLASRNQLDHLTYTVCAHAHIHAGPGIDKKHVLQQALQALGRETGCTHTDIIPTTLYLNDTQSCVDFYTRNHLWADSPSSLWCAFARTPVLHHLLPSTTSTSSSSSSSPHIPPPPPRARSHHHIAGS